MRALLIGLTFAAASVLSASAWFHVSKQAEPSTAALPEWMDPYEADLTLADLRLEDQDGQALALDPNKVYLVNFWARWCGPCIAEMPSLADLANAMDSKGVEVIAVSVMDGKPAAVEAYLERQPSWQGIDFAYPFAPDITAQLGARGLPATVIFDKSGRGVAQHFAPADWAAEEVPAYLTALAE